MFSLRNPLPKQLRDTRALKNLYKEWNLVPYASYSTYTGHRFLSLLTDMAQLSGTHGSCIKDLTKWAFGGEINLFEKQVAGLRQESKQLSPNDEVRLAKELERYGVSPLVICGVTKRLFQSKKKTGNFYLRYKEVTVGSTKKVFLEPIPPMNVMYLNTEPDEPEAVVISKDFFNRSGFTEEPRLIRVYPNFSGTEGNRETVIHVKEEDEEDFWYGRPDSIQALYWMATEWYQSLHSLKVTKTETVAKAILAMMNPHPNSLGQGESVSKVVKTNRVEINRLTTNKGADSVVDSVGVVGYPHDGEAPSLLKLDINRDHQFMDVNTRLASDYIASAHGWDKTLIGFDRPSSGIGGNLMLDTFEVRNVSTIRPIQREYESQPWGIVLKLMAEFTGVSDFENISPRFTDRIEDLLVSMDGRNHRRNGRTTNGNGDQQDTDNGSGGQDTGEGQ